MMVMDTTSRKAILTGAFLIFVAIILGAFGAHGLQSKVSPEKIVSFETGVRYQIYAGMSLLLIVGIQGYLRFATKTIFNLLIIGAICFSGSIYILATEEIHGLVLGEFIWPVTPIGGLLMILAWIMLFVKVLGQKN